MLKIHLPAKEENVIPGAALESAEFVTHTLWTLPGTVVAVAGWG